jgi:hypothetical protein
MNLLVGEKLGNNDVCPPADPPPDLLLEVVAVVLSLLL